MLSVDISHPDESIDTVTNGMQGFKKKMAIDFLGDGLLPVLGHFYSQLEVYGNCLIITNLSTLERERERERES